MRLSVQLGLALVLAAVIPVLVAGWLVGSRTTTALQARVQGSQMASARTLAAATDRWLGDVVARLELSADVFDLPALTPEARLGALRLLYRQLEEASVVAVLDHGGHLVGSAVRLEDGAAAAPHLPVSDEELGRFLERVPVTEALASGEAVGEAYLVPRKHAVMLPVAVRVPGEEGGWVLAVELALRAVQRQVAQASGDGVGAVSVVDEQGRILADPDGARFMTRSALGSPSGQAAGVQRLEGPGGTALVAVAPLARRPWRVVVSQPAREALAPVVTVQAQAGLVVGVAATIAGLVGFVLAAGIARPLRRAARSARAIAEGDFEVGLAPSRTAEVQDLAAAFEVMSAELGRSRSEVEGMNRSLQAQVEERTRALSQAQAELMESRKLAAVGELGAGVAHELNNPLTGILGTTQLLLRRHREGDASHEGLKRIEADARRCRDVTANLLQFSERGGEAALRPLALNEVVEQAVDLKRALAEASTVALVTRLADALPAVLGDAGQLQQVILHLLANALSATPAGGRISVETGRDDAFVWVQVSDTGRGIDPENLDRIFEPFFTTKDDWAGAGLGLSVSYRIVEAHHGTLRVESQLGEGARFTLALPLSTGQAVA